MALLIVLQTITFCETKSSCNTKTNEGGRTLLLVTKIPANELLERRCSKQQVDTTSAGRSKQWRKLNLQQWWWLSISYIGDADRRAVVAAAVDTLQWWLWRRPTSIGCGGGQHSGGGCRQAAVVVAAAADNHKLWRRPV